MTSEGITLISRFSAMLAYPVGARIAKGKALAPEKPPFIENPYPGGSQVIREAFQRRGIPPNAIDTMFRSLSENTIKQRELNKKMSSRTCKILSLVAANNLPSTETATDESCSNGRSTGLSCVRRIIFEKDLINENESITAEAQTQSSPVVGTSNFSSTSQALSEHYVVERESSTKLKLRKVKQSYREYYDSEHEPFSAGSSDEYNRDDDNNNNDSFSSNEIQKTSKILINPNNWKQVKAKRFRNSGQQYTSRTGKIVKSKSLKPACSNKCIPSCSKKFSEEFRSQLFKEFWDLGNLQRQRDFLGSCIEQLILKYRRVSSAQPRKPNCAFYLHENGKKIRGIIKEDHRGKHGNHKRIDVEVSKSVFDHINSIPRIESHYVRKDTNSEFIDGGLTIAEMHRDYYHCDLCETYKNAPDNEKIELKHKYEEHLEEKDLSRKEKESDKRRAEDGEMALAVYDLQAVLPVPITELAKDTPKAFFWHEVFGNRGAIEIGTYVLMYLEELSKRQPGSDAVFFSDNCMGQQKNRFLIAVYIYTINFSDDETLDSVATPHTPDTPAISNVEESSTDNPEDISQNIRNPHSGSTSPCLP
ncbi:hypothetical protein NQ314_008818 [Rhamnusium bicolor]|uniref:Uncharacterized protein n=1 Tax=Rhamnusium bicolor TaxID=1586634 RepID=A0AAV8Y5A8_9CUCU|nr:hypothetical protein NQ314_008818 [Rhamnusium bicolor]